MSIADIPARELRQAARALRRTPSFTVVTLLTLALGIGAATAIFTLLDAVVLRPLPYPDADRLVTLSSPVPKLRGQTVWGIARHEMFYFLERGHTFRNIGIYQMSDATVLGGGTSDHPERVRAAQVSASLFDVLGFTPERGRLFVPDDNHNSTPTVAVLGHGYWQRRFGGAESVVGSVIDVDGQPLTVVGVLPAGADLPDLAVDLWTPAWVDSTTVWNNHTWSAIGRLKPGVTAAAAQRDLAPLTNRLPEVFPKVYGPRWIEVTGFRTAVQPLRDAVVGPLLTRALWTLFGAVALVLLVAGANVANLFLARLDARRRESALRAALGAARAHRVWHALAESMLLAAGAAVLAVVVAQVAVRVMVAVAPSELPRLAEVHVRGASIAFAAGLALLAGLTFGLLPLLSSRIDLGMLRDMGHGLTATKGRMMVRRLLVASQMALAVVLLAAAMLMVRTFRNLRAVHPGFDARGVLTLDIALPEQRYGGDGSGYAEAAARASSFYEQLAQRVRALPGVRDVGFVDRMPLVSGNLCTGITLEGPTPESAQSVCPPSTMVSPGYFEAMGIRVDGRTLEWSGMDGHDGAVVVSRAFAEHYWPGESPLGKGIRFNGTTPPFYRVVGVADDVRGLGVDAPPQEYVYFPMLPIPDAPLWHSPTYMHLVLRTGASNPMSLAGSVTRIAQELEPQVAVANVATMETLLARSMAKQSFTMVLLLIAALMATLLSAVGIYGVLSYLTAQRRGEIGVRLALGARPPQVAGMVLRQSLVLAMAGVAVGVLAAWGTTRALRALLFGVQPGDPVTMLAVPVGLVAVAALAAYIPARRAARIDPASALRE
ncbi:MAG TPA: ABC transporter permease [Gemmatimonadaceae bacterium]|nr:ABC transporter permease [Gemmatimonadaceae bacterium]